jgi:hypothetical protein
VTGGGNLVWVGVLQMAGMLPDIWRSEMPAVFRTYDDEYYTYDNAANVKEGGGKYSVYDAYGNVLGAHPTDSIAEFTTSSATLKGDQDSEA